MIKAVIFDLFETLVTQYDPLFNERIQIHEISTLAPELFLNAFAETAGDRHRGKFITRFNAYQYICEHQGGTLIPEKLEAYENWHGTRKSRAFAELDESVLAMLSDVREKGINIALITDCEFYEIDYFMNSSLPPLIDETLFSCREGVAKPDHEIYRRALNRLNCQANECLYLGDGGSSELQGARETGMTVYQAFWFLKQFDQEYRQKADLPFPKIYEPGHILDLLGSQND